MQEFCKSENNKEINLSQKEITECGVNPDKLKNIIFFREESLDENKKFHLRVFNITKLKGKNQSDF